MFHARTATSTHGAPGAADLTRSLAAPAVPPPSTAPAAPAARTAASALALAVFAAGLLAFSMGNAAGAPPGETKAQNHTVAGTAMTPDGRTPVPRVRITVMPESTITYTDVDGDFLVAWDGRDGWITMIPEERDRNGGEWCKRVILRAATADSSGPIVDLGIISVMPKAQVGFYNGLAAPPAYSRPRSFRVPGPRPGEPDTCRMEVSYGADPWGRIIRVEITGGNEPPTGLKDAIFSWIRGVPWNVSAETACDAAEPFKTRQWMDYAWADTAWVAVPGPKLQDRVRPPVSAPPHR